MDEGDEIKNEYDKYQWEFINGVPTEKPIKKDDHAMNSIEYGVWGCKEYFGINI